MDLHRLRYFLQVADAGSFSGASARLGVAQPSLSRQISRLEEEIGVSLFYRHGRGVSLTGEGEKLKQTAEQVFDLLEQIRDGFRASGEGITGEVRWGLPPSIGATLAFPVARDFMTCAPNAKLHVREAFSAILSDWIEEGVLDVAVMYDAARNKTLNATPLLLEDLFLIRSRNHTEVGDVSIEELADMQFVLPGERNGLRRVIDRAFLANGIRPKIVMEVDSIPALRQMAGGGIGTSILPFGAIHREVRNERLNARRIASPEMRALLVTTTPSNKAISSATKELIQLVEERAKDFVESDVLRGVVGKKIGSVG